MSCQTQQQTLDKNLMSQLRILCIRRLIAKYHTREHKCWRLKGNGKFDTQSFYHKIQDAKNSLFPWKGVWKTMVPKQVAFFLWTAAHGQIFTLDNLMLRGRSLANRCCMCHCDGESVDHLLLHCPVTHTPCIFMLQAFNIHWVMPSSVTGLLFCSHQWLGNHSLNIWNLIPS